MYEELVNFVCKEGALCDLKNKHYNNKDISRKYGLRLEIMRSKPKICFQENKKLQIITKHMSIIE
jgi:hypothetical protein